MPAEKTLWAVGLDAPSLAALKEYAGEYIVKECAVKDFLALCGGEEPPAAWLSLEAWRQARVRETDMPDPLACCLVVEASLSAEELEEAASHGFAAVLHEPLEEIRIRDALLRIEENRRVYRDIMAMGKEIMLCRDIIHQKDEHLGLLTEFMSVAAAQDSPEALLRQTFTHLAAMLPLDGLAALIGHADSAQTPRRTFFVPAKADSEAAGKWIAALEEAHTQLLAFPFLKEAVNSHPKRQTPTLTPAHIVSLHEKDAVSLPPCLDKKRMLFIPLHAPGMTVGLACLQFSRDCNLGRERLSVLNAVMQHTGALLRVFLPGLPMGKVPSQICPTEGHIMEA